MVKGGVRDQKTAATRRRIAEAGLQLFVSQGYTDTTIDDIAATAGVARRTVFHHFATKEAILIDHLVVRQDVAQDLLRERPIDEPPLVSLHAVLREMCEQGYDREMLAQARLVLAHNPGIAGDELTHSIRLFEKNLIATLEQRPQQQLAHPELRTLTLMALSWVDAAVRTYLIEERPSLVDCYDQVVALCAASLDELERPPMRRP